MSSRASMVLFLLALILIPQAQAKNKKKRVLPDYVLKAETVLVVIPPDAGEPLTRPTANRTAQEEVEKAIMKWGRFRLVLRTDTADLVIAVRKGLAEGPTIRNSPVDNDRPVIFQQTDDQVRVAVQHGQTPDLTNSGPGGSESRRPSITNEAGPPEDTFEVYQGKVQDPLDTSPVWRYSGKDALNAPQVDAVEQFRKAIAESEKQHQKKP